MNGKSSLDCKYKHMMKYGAPPDKFGVLCRVLTIEFHVFYSGIDFTELLPLCAWNYLRFCKDGIGPFNKLLSISFMMGDDS